MLKKSIVRMIVCTYSFALIAPQAAAIPYFREPIGPFAARAKVECVQERPQVVVTWESVVNAKSYTVERKLAHRTVWEVISAPSFIGTSFVDSDFRNPRIYHYRVSVETTGRKRVSNGVEIEVRSCEPGVRRTNPIRRTGRRQAIQAQPAPSTPERMWGVYAGYNDTDLPEFEEMIGKSPKMVAAYVSWGNYNEFPTMIAEQAKRKTFVIFWDPWDYENPSVVQPKFSYSAILNGEWDEYIRTFAAEAKKHRDPIILVPFRDMNVDWNVWSGKVNGNTAELHKQAYKYVHDFFADVPNVKFGWSINNISYPSGGLNTPQDYYPGDDLVDYVGVDGYNTGEPWEPFNNVFNISINTLKGFKKPIIIFTMTAADDPRKARWITDAMTQMSYYPEIVGWIWYNEKTDKDWRVWSNDEALKAFKEAVK